MIIPQYISGLLWIISAVFFIALGIYEMVRYLIVASRDRKMGDRHVLFLVRAVLMIIFGAVILQYNSIFVTIASITFGIFFITEGIVELMKVISSEGLSGAAKWFGIAASVVSVILGAIILSPWGGIVTVIRLIGAALVVSGLGEMGTVPFSPKR
ncbi:Short repeat of unknown function [Ruminococcaceae bacterium YRB3002]|nr:Short repeat of unknown function [Ruminococcaceae bacterium YRB3002]